LEIKKPQLAVIKLDESHKGSWVWSSEVNKAIGQVVNYMDEISTNKLAIEDYIRRQYKQELSITKPRAFILIGQKLNDEEKTGLRKLNSHLQCIEVITYDELLNIAQSFLFDNN
jgi:hypothetical protein